MLKIQCFILSISRAWQCWAMIGFLLGFWAIFFVFLGRTLSFPLCLIRFAKKKFVFYFFGVQSGFLALVLFWVAFRVKPGFFVIFMVEQKISSQPSQFND